MSMFIKRYIFRYVLMLTATIVFLFASNYILDGYRQVKPNQSQSTDIPLISQSPNYVIFDASGFSGSLFFLDAYQEEWRVLVVNLEDPSQLKTCKICYPLKDDLINTSIVHKWNNHLNEAEIDQKELTLMTAIMFVLSQKASWIYVTNRPVPIPYHGFKRVTKQDIKSGLVYNGSHSVFEPCSHFMDPFTWEGLGVHQVGNRYALKDVSLHSVYYVLNECFRKDMSQQDWQNSLDTRAPIPHTMPGTFAAVDFKNILVSRLNAWTLVASVLPGDKDITQPWSKSLLINLIVQRVLWETRSNVGFLPDLHNIGHGCPTCHLQTRLEQSGEDILGRLTKWRCENSDTVLKCLMKLSTQDIVPNKQIKNIVSFWISLMNSYGLPSIERYALNDTLAKEKTKGIHMHFTPAKSLHKSQVDDTRPPNFFKQLCSIEKEQYVPKIPDKHKNSFDDVLLVIIYNWDHDVKNIPNLEYTYGRHFKHVLHCSNTIVTFKEVFRKYFNNNPVSFIAPFTFNGVNGYNCITSAMRMGYDVKGYLQISDDVLLNVWNLYRLPYDRPWFQSKLKVANIFTGRVPSVWIFKGWVVWSDQQITMVRNTYKQLLDMLSDSRHADRVSSFLKTISSMTRCDHCFLYETSDILYVPRRLISNFTFFMDVFSRNTVHLEVAIPSVLFGISSESDVYRLRGNYIWYEDRSRYSYVWTEFDHFYHAFKTSDMGENDIKFYCEKFIAKVDDDLVI